MHVLCMIYTCVLQMTKKGTLNRDLKRKFFHWVVEQLALNIEEYRHGFLFRFSDGVVRWMVPVLSYVITDWPEGQMMSLVGGGARHSRKNCRVCFRPTATMSQTGEGDCYKWRKQRDTMALVQAASQRGVSAKDISTTEVLPILYPFYTDFIPILHPLYTYFIPILSLFNTHFVPILYLFSIFQKQNSQFLIPNGFWSTVLYTKK